MIEIFFWLFLAGAAMILVGGLAFLLLLPFYALVLLFSPTAEQHHQEYERLRELIDQEI